MSTMGTFDAFTAARLGIYAAQFGFQVTGNNISNINTEGYTRQRLDQVSFKAGAYDMYRSPLDNHVGSGALVMDINQVRDPYLDLRYRNTSSDVGYSDTMLAGLQQIANILDEVNQGEDVASNEQGDGILFAQIQDLADKLRAYANEPTDANDILVRNSAQTLCFELNKYANALNNLYQETVNDFNSQITEINECLTNIRELNREIRDCEVYGDNALELRDERNRQIDTLSQYLHIKVVYGEEDIGCGQTVEKLSIYLAGDNPDGFVTTDDSLLIDGIYGAQLSSPEERVVLNPDYGHEGSDLKDFLYLKTVVTDDTTNPPTTEVQGTNFVDEADKVPNDIFAVQISKLVDKKGNEWTGKVTGQVDITEKNPTQAVYEFKLSSALAVGEIFNIGTGANSIEYTVTQADLDDVNTFAANIAQSLNQYYAAEGNNDYTVSAKDNDTLTLVFTANNPGEIGQTYDDLADQPPAQAPSLTVLDGGNLLKLTKTTCVNPGYENAPPADLVDAIGTTTATVDPDTGTETTVSYLEHNGRYYEVTTVIRHTYDVALDDNDLHGSLQATRELLTEAGEFATADTIANVDENAAKKRGIPYYINALDLFAKTFAEQYNQINQGYAVDQNGNYLHATGETDASGNPIYEQMTPLTATYYVDADGNYLGTDKPDDFDTVDEGTYQELTATLNSNMTANEKQAIEAQLEADGTTLKDYLDENGTPMGGVLFSNRNDNNDPTGITASNISVSNGWSTMEWQLVPKFEVLFSESGENLDHSTQNTNANHMLNMIEKGLLFNPKDIVGDAASDKLFEGNFNDLFNYINTTLGNDMRATNMDLNMSYTQLVQTDASREGVSGVDLNDEAMNLIQFQKAYSAACRLMTVVDEALDRLINNTAI